MKFTFAIACLLGLTLAENAQTSAQKELVPFKDVTVLQMEESESDSEEEENVGLDKVIDENPIYNAWESVKDGAADGKYERVVTSNFAADSDDIFMRSMITKYAH